MALILPVLLLQQVLGGLTFPIAKYGLAEIEPFTFAFFRFVIAATVLQIIVRIQNPKPKVERRDLWKMVGLGLIIIPFNQVAYLYGQSLTGAGHGALLFAMTPIFVFILALIHLKEKLRPRRAIGILVAVGGVMVIMTSGAVEISADYLRGDLIILVAVLAWAYYTVLGKPLAEKYGALRVTAYALGFGALFYVPFGFYRAVIFDYSAVTSAGWWSVGYVAIGTSVLTYSLYYWVLKQMDASRVAVFHNLQPIVATGIGFFWLGEQVGMAFLIGGLIAIGGVLLAETK